MHYLFLALALTLALAAEEPQPQEVLSAMASYEKGVKVALASYQKEEAKVRNEVGLKLEAAKVAYTKRGDLEGALLVVAAIKKLHSGEALTAVEENAKNVLTATPSIVGKWNISGGGAGIVTINGEMKAKHSAGVNGVMINNTINWNNGTHWKLLEVTVDTCKFQDAAGLLNGKRL